MKPGRILVAALLVALALGAQSHLAGQWPWTARGGQAGPHHRQPGSVPGRMRIDGRELVSPVSPRLVGDRHAQGNQRQGAGLERTMKTIFGAGKAWRRRFIRTNGMNSVLRKNETE